MKRYSGRDIINLIFGNLFAETRRRAGTVSRGSNGFRACAVHPVYKYGVLKAAMVSFKMSNREAVPTTSIYATPDSSNDLPL
jgi:hypothetical protein